MTDLTTGAEAPRVPYANVNGQWPERLPELTLEEARTAIKRLWKMALNRPCPIREFKVTTGNRRTRILHGTYCINLRDGWHALVHSVSHRCFARLHPNRKPHDARHAHLEREMIQHVVESGWLDGKLKRPEKAKPTPTKSDKQADKLTGILERIKRWEQKERRAQTALAKLSKQRRYYERQLAV